MTTKMKIDERLKILDVYLNDTNWMGGAIHFQKVPLKVLKTLVKKKYLKLSDRQNEAPTAGQFIKFMTRWKKYPISAHGYIISLEREDKRTSIEGLEIYDTKALNDAKFISEWYNLNRKADELDKNRSWFD